MKPSLVFFGSFQHYSTKILKSIVESNSANVLAVVTTPNADNPTTNYAKSVGLPVLTPKILHSPFSILHSKKSVDFFVVAGYGNILPQAWLDYPKIAPLNLHFSLLPKYRGANPAEWAILSGERRTGVTLIKMDAGLDTGPIIAQQSLPIIHPPPTGVEDGGEVSQFVRSLGQAESLAKTNQSQSDDGETNFRSESRPGKLQRHLASTPNKKDFQSTPLMSQKISVAQVIAFPTPDTRETLYEKLYNLAGQMIVKFFGQLVIEKLVIDNSRPQPQVSPTPYARRLTRPDGFISWPVLQKAIHGKSVEHFELPHLFQEVISVNPLPLYPIPYTPYPILIERASRALLGYPDVWTTVNTKKGAKRLKLLSCHLVPSGLPRRETLRGYTLVASRLVLDKVQLEGLNPSTFNQIKNQIL